MARPGAGKIAANIGLANTVPAVGVLNNAYAYFSTNTAVTACPGPLATAGSLFQNGVAITKSGSGININNSVVIGGAAAPTKAARAGLTTATARPAAHTDKKKKSTGSTAAPKHASKK